MARSTILPDRTALRLEGLAPLTVRTGGRRAPPRAPFTEMPPEPPFRGKLITTGHRRGRAAGVALGLTARQRDRAATTPPPAPRRRTRSRARRQPRTGRRPGRPSR